LRVVSNIIGLLIVVGVVIALSVSVSLFISGYVQRTVPQKGALTLSGSTAEYDTSTRTLWITARGYYTGSEVATVRERDIKVLIAGIEISPSVVSYTQTLTPNSQFKAVLAVGTSTAYPQITIVVTYCFADETCYQAFEHISSS